VRNGNGSKELMAQAPCGVFQIPPVTPRLACHIGAVPDTLKPEFLRKPGDEKFIFVGFSAAKLMVEMQNEKPDSELPPQIGQEAQECHRVRAARNPDADAVSRTDHRMMLDGVQNSHVESTFHGEQIPARVASCAW
jgi:hypothetical protein